MSQQGGVEGVRGSKTAAERPTDSAAAAVGWDGVVLESLGVLSGGSGEERTKHRRRRTRRLGHEGEARDMIRQEVHVRQSRGPIEP